MESHVCDTQKWVWFDTVCFTSVSPLWGAVSRDILTCTEGSDLPSGIHCSWTEEVQSSFELSPLIFLNTPAVWSESFILQTYNETGFLASYLRCSCRLSHSAPVDWKGKWTELMKDLFKGKPTSSLVTLYPESVEQISNSRLAVVVRVGWSNPRPLTSINIVFGRAF